MEGQRARLIRLPKLEGDRRMSELPPHPDQPIHLMDDGVARFRQNKIVRFLLDAGPFSLNSLDMMPWDNEDYTQLMQLIGYSVSGYGDLSTSPKERVARADAQVKELLKEPTFKRCERCSMAAGGGDRVNRAWT